MLKKKKQKTLRTYFKLTAKTQTSETFFKIPFFLSLGNRFTHFLLSPN